MAITYQVELLKDIFYEIKSYAEIHYQEIANNKDQIPLDMDWRKYFELEEQDILHIVTARDELESNKIIGYHWSFVGPHLHYKSTLHAMVDLYYVDKEYRHGRTGLRLFQYAEQSLKELGVTKIMTGTKVYQDHSRIFEFLKYTYTERQYIKII